MSGWQTTRLGDLCKKVTSGGTPLRSVKDYYEGGTIPWLKTGEVKKGYVWETEEHITERGLRDSSAKLIPANSLIVAMYGDGDTAGNVAINKVPLATNQACCNFIPDPSIADYRFLYHYLKGSYSNLVGLKLGGSQQNLNAATLKSFPINFPSLAIQQKIAAILSAYDDLIANNQRRIALLERMAADIYREWFVRLRFPGHAQVKIEKGVPQGWTVCNLGDVLELCYGKALKDEARLPGYIPVYGSGGVVGTHSAALVEGPGIVVGRKGNVGSVFWSDVAFFPIDTVYYVRSDVSLYYLVFLLRSMNFINNDAAVPGLSRQQAYANKLLCPPEELINQFTAKVKSLFEMRRVLSAQIEQLKATRDALLPRLISGQLPVDGLDIQFPRGMAAG